MKASRSLAGLLILWFLLTLPRAHGQAADLLGGAARVDITPTLPCKLSGYASRTNLSTGVHDPLSARALAFQQNGRRLVLVSTDLIGFYGPTGESLRQSVRDACKLRPEELMLAAIHTHSAPTPALDPGKVHPNNVEYTTLLRGQLVKVVQEALARLRPVNIAVGTGASPVGVNRRQPVKNKEGRTEIRLGRNPAGSTDPEVQVLQVRERGADRLAAVLFAYATHSTSLGTKNLLISGDVHGLAEQFVERSLGAGVIAPGFAGASGNIDPWFRVLPEFKSDNGWVPEPVLLGTMLGEEIVHTSIGIRAATSQGPVKSLQKTVELPVKPNRTPSDWSRSAITITVGRVGDVALVGLSAEVFNEIGRAIKNASPFAHTFIITHCNGGSGYLPIKEAYDEGGYEVKTSPFAPEAAAMVVKEATALLKQLKGD